MRQLLQSRIGQILLDIRALSQKNLAKALQEQKQTKELLGQVLGRMGVLKAQDINAPLLVQEHLSTIEDAVKIAAGERQLLGDLFVQSGRITAKQLDQAITEQKKSGEKLGVVLTRLGMLTERQLSSLLEFQHHQEDSTHSSPLRLGELLLATGYITRSQLDDALSKQSISHKKIGEVLVEEGYVSKSRIKSGFRLQKMLVSSVLAAILSLGMSAATHASTVQLQWDTNTEPDLAGYKVYHNIASSPLAGTVPLDVSLQTTATISGLDPDTDYSFAVTSYNTAGVESSFSNILTFAEQTPPTITITTPADSASVSGIVSISVTAADNVGVTKVEFYVNGVLKSSDTVSPYVYSWDTTSLAAGMYTLLVKAYDAAGNVSQSSRTVSVVKDLIAPTVAITSPASNATLSGTVAISASASDNVGVSMVEFYSNTTLLYASNVAPYSYSWNTRAVANGVYFLTVKAYDASRNVKVSSTVSVAVQNEAAVKLSIDDQNALYFNTISAALTTMQTSTTKILQLRGQEFANNVTIDRCGEAIIVKGGYNTSFSSQTGSTAIYGALTVSCGSATIENLVIR